jgi:DNA-binding CsgD family transcriptional regulator
LGAIESLLAIGGKHPWWAIAIFVISLWVLHGLIVFSEDFETQT